MDDARTLLNRIPALQRPCDLDLLVFLAKHPQTLLSSDQLARLLGYQLKEVASSRDALLAAGFLKRTENPTRRSRMYVLAPDVPNGRSLSAVVELASTREGRLALRQALVPLRQEIRTVSLREPERTRRQSLVGDGE